MWYKRAHLDNPAMSLATEFGRQIINGTLCPIMMSLPSKPDVLQSVSCKCKSSKCLKGYSCAKASIDCCIACARMENIQSCGRIQATDVGISDSDNDFG